MSNRRCGWCGKVITGKDRNRKQFCCREHYIKGSRISNPSKVTLRKRAQRDYPARKRKCAVCGSTKDVQRHHESHTAHGKVIFLCKKHHAKRDMKLGKWGTGKSVKRKQRRGE